MVLFLYICKCVVNAINFYFLGSLWYYLYKYVNVCGQQLLIVFLKNHITQVMQVLWEFIDLCLYYVIKMNEVSGIQLSVNFTMDTVRKCHIQMCFVLALWISHWTLLVFQYAVVFCCEIHNVYCQILASATNQCERAGWLGMRFYIRLE